MKLIMLRGPQASGKTTWAKEYQQAHPLTKRVNRDELRAMIDDSQWSHQNEKLIIAIEKTIVIQSLFKKHDVIIDDTNVTKDHERMWRSVAEIASIEEDIVEFEIKDFDTTPEECVMRDSKREGRARVGPEVIWNTYKKYVENKTQN